MSFCDHIVHLILEPNTIDDIFANIRTVGEFTGRASEADQMIERLTARLGAVASAIENVERHPRTLMLEWLEPAFAPGHWVPEQVRIAGGDAAFGREGQPSVTTTAEATKTTHLRSS